MAKRYKKTPLYDKIKSFFTKRNIKIISTVFFATVLIFSLCVFVFSDSRPVKEIKGIGFQVLTAKTDGEKTKITVSSGADKLSENDLILARYAKDFIDKSDYNRISVVIRTKEGKDIVSIEKTEENKELKTPLDLYMEESLLKFKTEYEVNKVTKGLLKIRVTDYPQCYIAEYKEKPTGRTLNISVRSTAETIEQDREVLKNILFELNSNGASVYVFNIAYIDAENNILKLTSINAESGNEIIINNYDTNK